MFFLSPLNRHVVKTNNNVFNFVDELFNDSFFKTNLTGSFRTDVKELENGYLIEAELPGIKKEEIKLEYKDQRLVIAVESEENKDQEKENYICKERRATSVMRSFYLGDINDELIEAKLEDGILKITVPKQENINTKQIEIK